MSDINKHKYGKIHMPEWTTKHSGADWIERAWKDGEMSEFGRAVADLLGQWQRGIYHIQKEVLHNRVKWDDDRYIEIVMSDSRMCTHDCNDLTRLVFLCHDYGIRVELYAAAPRYIRLVFYNPTQVALVYPHPTLREAVGLYRYYEGGKEAVAPNSEGESSNAPVEGVFVDDGSLVGAHPDDGSRAIAKAIDLLREKGGDRKYGYGSYHAAADLLESLDTGI